MLHPLFFIEHLKAKPALVKEFRETAETARFCLGKVTTTTEFMVKRLLDDLIAGLDDPDFNAGHDYDVLCNALYSYGGQVCHYKYGPNTRRPEMQRCIERLGVLMFRNSNGMPK